MFDDLLEANRAYQDTFPYGDLTAPAARGLAVLTCIDSRIEPLVMLGLKPGDAKILRNAGARVTDDALRSLVLATNLLNVSRICIVPHTDCAMGRSEDEIERAVSEARGLDASGWNFHAAGDQLETVKGDIARLRDCEMVAPGVQIGALLYDVKTGEVRPLDV